MPSFYNPKSLSPKERLEHAKRFLSAYGDNHDVHFQFDKQPQTDGKTVWLGSLDPEEPYFIVRALGHGMHEMLHVTDTNLTQYRSGAKSVLGEQLINVFEDVRIDTLGMSRYPGYRVWRNELADLLASEGALRAAQDPKEISPADLLGVWLHAELLAPLNVGWAQRYHLALRSEMLNRHSPTLVEKLLNVARTIEKAKSTEDVSRIVEKILELLLKENLASSRKEDDLFDAPKGNEKERDIEILKSVAVKKLAAKHASHPESDIRSSPTKSAFDAKHFTPALWPENTTDRQLLEDAELYSEKFCEHSAELKMLTTRFKHILQGPVSQPQAQRSGSNLSPDFALRALMRDNRLFENERTFKRTNADIVLLLDRSGSMGVERMTKAKIALASLVKALSPIHGIETTCALFPGPNRVPLSLVKTREESEALFLRRFAGIGAFGATPFTEAVYWAIDTLKTSHHKKRLLLVVTDGLFQEENAAFLREALKANQIEMALLNIDTENPAVCENTVHVTESADIGKALIELIEGTSFAKENGRT